MDSIIITLQQNVLYYTFAQNVALVRNVTSLARWHKQNSKLSSALKV